MWVLALEDADFAALVEEMDFQALKKANKGGK